MKKYKRNIGVVALSVAAFISIGTPVQAGTPESSAVYTQVESSSFYLSGFGGVNWADDFEASGSGVNIESDFDAGYIVGTALGYEIPVMGGLRFEVEGAYRSNDLDSIISNGNRNQGEGEISVWSVMFNVAKDFPLSDNLSFYAGGGVGLAGLDADFAYGSARVNEKDEVFAWQVFAGLSYELASNFEVYSEYRFFQAVDPELSRLVRGASRRLDGDSYDNHGILLGARFSFLKGA